MKLSTRLPASRVFRTLKKIPFSARLGRVGKLWLKPQISQ